MLNSKEDQRSHPVILKDIPKKNNSPSIDKIRKTYESNKKFSFEQVTGLHVRQVILSIDDSNATLVGDVPAEVIRIILNIHISLITKIIKLFFEDGYFADHLKLSGVSTIFQKSDGH